MAGDTADMDSWLWEGGDWEALMGLVEAPAVAAEVVVAEEAEADAE